MTQAEYTFGAVRYRSDGDEFLATEIGTDVIGKGETPHEAIRDYLTRAENHE